MARALSLLVGVVSVVGAGGCSLLMLDDMDLSANADRTQTMPTSNGPSEKEAEKDGTLPAPPANDANDAGGGGEGGAPPSKPGETCMPQVRTPTSTNNQQTGNGQRPSWTNTDNAKSSDAASASVSLPSGEESSRLQLRAFKFNIPENARIKGVFVDVTKAPSGAVQDSALNLEIDPATRRPTNSTMPWFSAKTVVRYGSSNPLWDYPLTPQVINSDAFGFNIVVKAQSGAATANVDAVSITVDYCVP